MNPKGVLNTDVLSLKCSVIVFTAVSGMLKRKDPCKHCLLKWELCKRQAATGCGDEKPLVVHYSFNL